MVATVKENFILFKVREKLGSFVSGHGISKSLFKVNEKSGNFILKGSANYFKYMIVCFDVFVQKRQFCFKNCPSHTVLFSLIHGQNNHLTSLVKILVYNCFTVDEKTCFCSSVWQPWMILSTWFDYLLECIYHEENYEN